MGGRDDSERVGGRGERHYSRTILSICDMMSIGSSSLLSRAFSLFSIQYFPIALTLRIALVQSLPMNDMYCSYSKNLNRL